MLQFPTLRTRQFAPYLHREFSGHAVGGIKDAFGVISRVILQADERVQTLKGDIIRE